ncbi:hypothetical protein BJV77DRAFT_920539, partial [Russula vinacea]
RWARLRIPTGQICYSSWKELQKPLEKRRTARMVKVLLNDKVQIAEVRFFVLLRGQEDHDREAAFALVSLFSNPDPSLLHLSINTLWSCEYRGDSALRFIEVQSIQAVVAMVPHAPVIEGQETRERFFLVEKPGLDV